MRQTTTRSTAALLAAVCLAAAVAMTHPGGAQAASGLTITQTSLGNVFIASETPTFTISTTGNAISWTVHDIWDKEVASGSGAVSGGSYHLSLPLAAKGWFHLAVKARAAGAIVGERDTSFAMLSSIPKVADSPFGYTAHIGESNPAGTFPLLAAAGARAVRTELYWPAVEKSRGVYDFSYYDQYLPEMLKQTGAFADLILAYTNPLYDGNLTPHDNTGLTAWARFAAATAAHYKGVAKWVEVYSGYDTPASTGPCAQSPTCYAQMLKYTYSAVKAANPDMTVIGGVSGSVSLPWLEKVLQAGGLEHMDVVSIRPYTWPNAPEGVEGQLAALDGLIRKYDGGKSKPIYATELGWTTARGKQGVDEATQARYVVRGQVLMQSVPAVERTFVYDFIDDGRDQANPAHGFGAVRNAGEPNGDYTPKPSYVANAVLQRVLLGAHRAGQDSAPGGVRSYRYNNGNHDVHVIWAPKPTTVTLHISDPVTVTDEMGNSTTNAPQKGEAHLTLSGDPVYVTGSVSIT